MPHHRWRVIIVACGAVELFDTLQACYAGDPATRVIWDRRGTPDRRQAVHEVPIERRYRQRRIEESTPILRTRGFFATQMVWRQAAPSTLPIA